MITKNFEEFYKDKSKKDGLRSICKDCDGRKHYGEYRCIECDEWFNMRTINQMCCSVKCSFRHKGKIYNKSAKGKARGYSYRCRNRKKLSKKSMEWYWNNREYAIKKSVERRKKRREKRNRLRQANIVL